MSFNFKFQEITKSLKTLFFTLVFILFFSACTSTPKNKLKVAASSIPHAEILKQIKEDLRKQDIDLIILVYDDYDLPNNALAKHEIDANFFQHTPFLEEQKRNFGYAIESIATIEVEPMGIYSKKLKSIKNLKENSTVAIPNDPTNEGRALLLLQDAGIIQIDQPKNLTASILNIRQNPKRLKFIEVDAALLSRTLEDVDIAAINTNYALAANLSPLSALLIEGKNSPYANVIVIRSGENDRPEIKALVQAITSDKIKEFILQKYKGSVVSVF